jgi:low molecular weight protein-tyrosine phosphatase
MASILVVCTGNVCRSPMAEGFLRAALARRLGGAAPNVSSAGTAGWEGSGAMPEAVRAVSERGLDIGAHTARRLLPGMAESADLVVCMAAEHRDLVGRLSPPAADQTFTLKELVRLLDELPALGGDRGGDTGDWTERAAAAAALRGGGFEGNALDEDVVDPLGMPYESYRAVAWELEEWTERLGDGLAGPMSTPVGEARTRGER